MTSSRTPGENQWSHFTENEVGLTPEGIADYSKLLKHTAHTIKPYEADKSPKEITLNNPPEMAEAHST